MNRLTVTTGLLLVLVTSAPASSKSLQIDGSTTVGPICDAFAEVFQKAGFVITVKKTGSGDGAAALVDGRCDVAAMSRFMKHKEFSNAVEKGLMPVAHVIAMDGVCVAVHPANPIKALTIDQIQAIFAGDITNWSQIGGPDISIVPISRDTSSGTFEVFGELVMKGRSLAGRVETVNSNPAMHARVSTTTGAIGYMGLGFIDQKVTSVTVDGVSPSRQTIASGTYPIARPLYLFTDGFPALGSLMHKFCTFHLTEKGHEIIQAKGFIPLTEY